MKKILLSALFMGCIIASVNAQTVTADTVTTNPQYAHQVWYSLESGQKTSIPASNWDIAFATGTFSVSILINDGGGAHLWKYPNGDESAWGTVDTTGISSWTESFNSETSWEEGAFNDHPGAGSFDYGWGTYNPTTHFVTGNSVFILQLSNGDFRKILIEQLQVNGTYNFKYADLDGANEVNDSLLKSDYSDKNFAYYSLQNHQALDPEPAGNDWDLLFTQYTTFIPMGNDTMPYKVTGVLSNINVLTAKVEDVDADTYTDYESHTRDSAKNVIGYDWKTYDMNNNAYTVADSTVFFVQDKSENIWKLVFTGFGGSSDGNFIFDKEKLGTTAIQGPSGLVASMAVYPNPVSNGHFTIAYNLKETHQAVSFAAYDLSGRMLFQDRAKAQLGMNRQTVSTASWAKGVYFLTMEAGGKKVTQKIIIH